VAVAVLAVVEAAQLTLPVAEVGDGIVLELHLLAAQLLVALR